MAGYRLMLSRDFGLGSCLFNNVSFDAFYEWFC